MFCVAKLQTKDGTRPKWINEEWRTLVILYSLAVEIFVYDFGLMKRNVFYNQRYYLDISTKEQNKLCNS